MVVRIPRALPVALAALLAAAPGCSDSGSDDDAPADGDDGDTADDDGADDDGADDAADDGTDDAADDGDGTGDGVFTVTWGPVTVPPGEEDTRCIRLRLPTDRPIRVGEIENTLGLSSHHLIVYRLADGLETTEPERCDPFVEVLDPTAGSPMAVTQRAQELIQLPPGVAFTLEASQMIRMELHYINATDEPQELRATTTFFEMPESEFEQEADFLFIGNPEINLPAAQPPVEPEVITLGPSFLPLPAELADVNIFAITGHQHHWGIDVQVSLATDAGDEGTPVYAPENFQWDEPETTYHDPPLTVPAGGGFNFTCSWQNFSEEQVGFGESVNDEMCFFWAYYYPSRGSRICFHTDELGGGVDLCCPSEDPLQNTLCQYVRTFLDGNN